VLNNHFVKWPVTRGFWEAVPKEMRDIIKQCLAHDAASRPFVKDIVNGDAFRALKQQEESFAAQAQVTRLEAALEAMRRRAEVAEAAELRERARAKREKAARAAVKARADREKARADQEKMRADQEKVRADQAEALAVEEKAARAAEKARVDQEKVRADQAEAARVAALRKRHTGEYVRMRVYCLAFR
jgi:dTMP kinase